MSKDQRVATGSQGALDHRSPRPGEAPVPPGKSAPTDRMRGPDDAGRARGALALARAAISAARTEHLPRLRDSIAARVMKEARAAAEDLEQGLTTAERELRDLHGEPDGAVELRADLEALAAEAAPLLAKAPPRAPSLPMSPWSLAYAPPSAEYLDGEARNEERWRMQVEGDDTHEIAAAGVAGPGGQLPHLDAIQQSFGGHDVSGIEAHVGGGAADAAGAIGAEAYATGNHVAFAAEPDLFVAAHEAAHVVQQRAGVQLLGGVGEAGDVYEAHADAVATAVVRGESAEPLLDASPTPGGRVQRKKVGASHSIDVHDLTPVRTVELIVEGAVDGNQLLERIAVERPSVLPGLLVAAIQKGAGFVALGVVATIEAMFWKNQGTGTEVDVVFLESLRIKGAAGAKLLGLFETLIEERNEKYPSLRDDWKTAQVERAKKEPSLAAAYATFQRDAPAFADELVRFRARDPKLYSRIVGELPSWFIDDWHAARRFARAIASAEGPKSTLVRVDAARAMHEAMLPGLKMREEHMHAGDPDGPLAALDWFVPALAEIIARPDVIKHMQRLRSNEDGRRGLRDQLRHYLRDILWRVHDGGTQREAREILQRGAADLMAESLEVDGRGERDEGAASHAGQFVGEYAAAEAAVGRDVSFGEVLADVVAFVSNFAGPAENVVQGAATSEGDRRRTDARDRIDRSVEELMAQVYEAQDPAPGDDPNDEAYEEWARQQDRWVDAVELGRLRAEREE